MTEAMALYEHLISRVCTDKDAWENCKAAIKQDRQMTISDFGSYRYALDKYVTFGPEYVKAMNVSNERLDSITPESLIDAIKVFRDYKHEVIYYGPRILDEVKTIVSERHYAPAQFKDIPACKEWAMVKPTEGEVIFVPFEETMNFDFCHYTTEGIKFDKDLCSLATLYTDYVGGGMNSIVFQDMREKKALVYSAWAQMTLPNNVAPYFYFSTYAESQSDKLGEVVSTFDGIINEMPQIETSFNIVKNGLLARLRTRRLTGMDLINYYITARDLGIDYDRSAYFYEKLQNLTLKDVVAYQQEHVKDKPFHYGIVGKKSALDFSVLRGLGTVKEITPEELFGY